MKANTVIRPITLAVGNAFIGVHHRHSGERQGWKFGLGVYVCGELVAVGMAGRPVASPLDDGITIEILRVCVNEPGAVPCSQIYGRLCRAAEAMGYTQAVSYTLKSEPGTSLRAAGFRRDGDVKPDHGNRKARPRTPREAVPRVRWVRDLYRNTTPPAPENSK